MADAEAVVKAAESGAMGEVVRLLEVSNLELGTHLVASGHLSV